MLSKVQRTFPGVVPDACDVDMLAWAHDMYVSRRFPAGLGMFSGGGGDSIVKNISNNRGNSSDTGENGETNKTSSSSSPSSPAKSVLQLPPRRSLRHTCSPLTQSLGIMLPLFDLLNHQYGADIDWSGDASGVAFHLGTTTTAQVDTTTPDVADGTGSYVIPPGGEIFNNYGNKGNESMLMAHGFCLHNNLHDSYGLKLLMRTSSDPQVAPVALGVFRLLRADNPDVVAGHAEQIPSRLWRAITQPDMFSSATSASFPPISASGGEGEKQVAGGASSSAGQVPAPIEIGIEDVELLFETVKRHLGPFAKTKEKDVARAAASGSPGSAKTPQQVSMDDMREIFVARYRDGQRRVLEDAMAMLWEMMGGGTDGSSET